MRLYRIGEEGPWVENPYYLTTQRVQYASVMPRVRYMDIAVSECRCVENLWIPEVEKKWHYVKPEDVMKIKKVSVIDVIPFAPRFLLGYKTMLFFAARRNLGHKFRNAYGRITKCKLECTPNSVREAFWGTNCWYWKQSPMHASFINVGLLAAAWGTKIFGTDPILAEIAEFYVRELHRHKSFELFPLVLTKKTDSAIVAE